MPPALANRPELPSHLLLYYEAYKTLSGFRTYTEAGYNPIGFQDVVTYAKINGLSDTHDDFEYFRIMIQACDNAFLSEFNRKRQEQLKTIKS